VTARTATCDILSLNLCEERALVSDLWHAVRLSLKVNYTIRLNPNAGYIARWVHIHI